jgi:prolyl-tRNA editing enzyme YbaK/EbsC (Cys-tRNA(Pro) deacylase)
MDANASVGQVRAWLAAAGHPGQVVTLADSARTAAEAAAALGCEVAQIAKSLIFATSGDPPGGGVLVIASGANRVDEARIAALLGEPIGKATAAQVRQWTGYAIGGVPPVAHQTALTTFVDADLGQYDQIWAAAGHPHAVFALTFADLVRWTGGTVAEVKAAPDPLSNR